MVIFIPVKNDKIDQRKMRIARSLKKVQASIVFVKDENAHNIEGIPVVSKVRFYEIVSDVWRDRINGVLLITEKYDLDVVGEGFPLPVWVDIVDPLKWDDETLRKKLLSLCKVVTFGSEDVQDQMKKTGFFMASGVVGDIINTESLIKLLSDTLWNHRLS